MARKPRTKMDLFEREIELAFEPGTFVPDGMCFSFVHDLEQIAATIDAMVGSESARAVVLYESFLAGCYQKADDLDDSSGGFGQFVGELYCGWVKARQANGADPDETVSRLLSWMDDDPYGFCYHLEKDVAGVLDRTHLAAFVKQIRARFDGAAATTSDVAAAADLLSGLPFINMELVDQEAFEQFTEKTFATDRDLIPKGMIEVIE